MREYLGEINRMLDRFLTPAVKLLLVGNLLIFVAMVFVGAASKQAGGWIFTNFALSSWGIIHHFKFWQFISYMFLHVDAMHIIGNMLVLWFFGPPIEERFGTRYFWKFYLLTGAGAGILHVLFSLATGSGGVYTVGASGAIYGIMLAYALYYPEMVVMFFGVYPIKMKYLMPILIFMTFVSSIGGYSNNISHVTHLTGLIVAFLLLGLRHRNWDFRRWRWQG